MRAVRLVAAWLVVVGLGWVAANAVVASPVPTAPPPSPVSLVPTSTTPVPVTVEADREGEVVRRVQRALDRWGRFATSGELSLLSGWFHPAGPQYLRLRQEAPTLAADPIGPPPYRFEMVPQRVAVGNRDATVEGVVTLTRSGEVSQRFHWQVVLRRLNGEWVVWTVVETTG